MAHSCFPHLPEDKNARRLLLAFVITAGFMVVETIGGVISGSLALLADAGHMLTDSAALLLRCWPSTLHAVRPMPAIRLAGCVY